MSKQITIFLGVVALVLVMGTAAVLSGDTGNENRDGTRIAASPVAAPNAMACVHDVGNVLFCVTNFGMLGSAGGSERDCETGLPAESFEFPAGSMIEYLFQAGIWVGAIVDGDTLVSVGVDGWQMTNELWPCDQPECGIEKRSNIPTSPYYHPDALSPLDMICEYTDTLTDPVYVHVDFDGTPHVPLNVAIEQQSHSWNSPENYEFVIIEYEVRAIGGESVDSAYLGLHIDCDVAHALYASSGATDDISGHRVAFPQALGGDSIEYAWSADNDGDPQSGVFDYTSATGVIGFAFLGPITSATHSFNWWMANGNPNFDWGPWLQSNSDFVYPTGSMGVPEGDGSKYFVMSNGETDYDQLEAALDHSTDGWLPPTVGGALSASGCDTRFLMSVGPFDITPDEPVRFAVVFAGGSEFHVNPGDFDDLFDPADPAPFQAALDFADLEGNLTAARLMYDSIHMGDINWDGIVDVDDAISMINYVYLGGDEPPYKPVTDLNCDGKIDLLDIIVLVNYIFRGGPLPGAGC